MRYNALDTEIHKVNGDNNDYRYTAEPKILLDSFERIQINNKFAIEVIWYFYDNESKFKKHQAYNCVIEQGDTIETIHEKIDELIQDSIGRLNRKDKNIDIKDYKEEIDKFKNSLPLK